MNGGDVPDCNEDIGRQTAFVANNLQLVLVHSLVVVAAAPARQSAAGHQVEVALDSRQLFVLVDHSRLLVVAEPLVASKALVLAAVRVGEHFLLAVHILMIHMLVVVALGYDPPMHTSPSFNKNTQRRIY